MGYLLAFSVAKECADSSKLVELPQSLPWKVFGTEQFPDKLVDVFDFRKDWEYPFSSVPAAKDLPLQFPDPLGALNELYDELRKKNRANGFKRAFINLNLQLSQLLSTEVLSVISDDEGTDLACVSVDGQLKKLRFRAGKIEANWSREMGIDLDKKSSSRLHKIAEDECFEFLNFRLPMFGFDGVYDSLELKILNSSPPLPPSPPKPPRGGWAAHERRLKEQARASRKWWQFWL
ncbi:hypothetical protein QQF45_00255 [Halopseudomonas aestusnigri]|uniref:hypothetical protein n=1 Tax=Halopseudomonas aestusnigri TaxID=857252 RepID=UPI002553FA49|nr:hypothetical protein [Halopseudomonas aestusnigri]MDL2197487.1 hypothetical protein [Halopseudomonas aestusnigri]